MSDKECCNKEDCGCSHEGHEHNHAQPNIEEIAYNNHFMINTLLALLIDKDVIKKDELEAKIKEIQEAQLKMHEEMHKKAAEEADEKVENLDDLATEDKKEE